MQMGVEKKELSTSLTIFAGGLGRRANGIGPCSCRRRKRGKREKIRRGEVRKWGMGGGWGGGVGLRKSDEEPSSLQRFSGGMSNIEQVLVPQQDLVPKPYHPTKNIENKKDMS